MRLLGRWLGVRRITDDERAQHRDQLQLIDQRLDEAERASAWAVQRLEVVDARLAIARRRQAR